MPPEITARNISGGMLPKSDRLATGIKRLELSTVLFYGTLVLLSLASLWPVWTTRFLPMQDYPQHLYLAQVMATYNDSSYNWKEFYRIDVGFRPYMFWYMAMKQLAAVSTVETAGKILFSMYILLIARLVLVARRMQWNGGLPWGGLLLFPFAFNQMYFMGFPNYILSLPLIFLALLDLDDFAVCFSSRNLVRHTIYLVLLFLIHPYSLLVYIALSWISACFVSAKGPKLRTLLPGNVMSLIFAVWYLYQHRAAATPTSVPWRIRWLFPKETLAYYLLQFTGMRFYNGVDWLSVGTWVCLGVLLYVAWRRCRGEISQRQAAWFAVCFVGTFVLPFWMGYYSYFNLRLVPVSYFALALVFCGIRIRLREATVLTVCIMILLVQSILVQRSVALEAESILPLAVAGEKNSLVLPLVYRAESNTLDPHFFYQMHSHTPDYYQLFVGGGATPTLFPNAMIPVQYRSGIMLPYPDKPEAFSWSRHGAYYDFILTREAPRQVADDLNRTCDLVARSGPWSLFKNRASRKPLSR